MTSPASAPPPSAPIPPQRGEVFRYESFATDAERGLLTCRYSLDGRSFSERFTLAPGPRWNTPAAQAAARLIFLLAGVSYYKTAAPPLIDAGDMALTAAERDFLRDYYLQGLGEFAYRNALDLAPLRIAAPNPAPPSPEPALPARDPAPPTPKPLPARNPTPPPKPLPARNPSTSSAHNPPSASSAHNPPSASSAHNPPSASSAHNPASASSAHNPPSTSRPASALRALVPFGGGIDSIVTVEAIRKLADVALFVVNRPGDRFDAIERPAAVAGLPFVRAGREIDPQLLRSAELGFFNGHVPVTGILSAIAVLAAVLDDRDAVVMSNEWSASVPTLVHNGRPVNHQYSKSASFEAAFRAVLAAQPAGMPEYFSALRDRTELWVAEEFAALERYHGSFRSCNRAFTIDGKRRLAYWCGQCDKCCFIDLILAPFMSADALRAVFAAGGGREPLADPALAPKFRTLLGSGTKPFECVGEVSECRAAVLLAARRPDRDGCALLGELAAEVAARPDGPTAADIAAMRRPVGENFIPGGYAFGPP